MDQVSRNHGHRKSPLTMWVAHSGRAEISAFRFYNNGFLNSLFYYSLFLNFRFQFRTISPVFGVGQFFIVNFLCELKKYIFSQIFVSFYFLLFVVDSSIF